MMKKYCSVFVVMLSVFIAFSACSKSTKGALQTQYYTVNFELCGGGGDLKQIRSEKNSVIKTPSIPEYGGYKFLGWFTEADSGILWRFDRDILTKNLTLYARWVSKGTAAPPVTLNKLSSPQVNIDKNGKATWSAVTDSVGYILTVNGGAEFPLLTTNYKLKDLQSIQVRAVGDGVYFRDSDYSPVSYCGTLNENKDYCYIYFYGADQPSQRIAYGEKIEKPNDPIRSGYTFGGWYEDFAYSFEFSFNRAVKSNTTIYGKWTKNEKACYYLIPYINNSDDYSSSIALQFNQQQTVFDEFYGNLFISSADLATGALQYKITDSNVSEKVTKTYLTKENNRFSIETTGNFVLYFSYENFYGNTDEKCMTNLSPVIYDKSQTEYVTFYYTDNTFTGNLDSKGRAKQLYAYCYSDQESNKNYPGMKMTYIRESSAGKKIWSFTVPSNLYNTVIINDGGTTAGTNKSPKIILDGIVSGDAFYINSVSDTVCKTYRFEK